ncbi:MAG: DUF2283 domain-containing protein [Candidatus Nanoarchaeia archaeon]|nr:DUF2283 domain-containing protein [Candidatus Nanoarchaeia archaeon]MDD5587805.1 DUF2283 domain-containing protein [Candidatus Nanoarchaeia archaeon]
MQKYNFSYDIENDDLFIFRPNCKSNASVEMGNFIFDYNNKKEFVGLQIINASKFLKDWISEEDLRNIKSILSSLKECKLDVKQENNLLLIKIFLFSPIKNIMAPIMTPRLVEVSPSLRV